MPMLKTRIGPLAYIDSEASPAEKSPVAKPVVMLLHSSAGSALQWRKLFRLLAPRYRVLAPDLIGYGATPMTETKPAMADEVAMIAALAGTFAGPFHLVGHSYGGAVALEAALALGGRLASLALFEPSSFHLLSAHGRDAAWAEIEAVAARHAALVAAGRNRECAEAFIAYWIGAGAFAKMNADTQSYVAATMPKVAADFRMVFANRGGAEAYGGFQFPILLLTGERSTLAARSVTAILKDALPGRVWQSFPAMGHMGPVSHADLVNASLADFIGGATSDAVPLPTPANDAEPARRSAASGGARRG